MAVGFKTEVVVGLIDKLTGPLKTMSKSFKPVEQAALMANQRFSALQAKTLGLRNAFTGTGMAMQNTGRAMSMGLTLPIVGLGVAVGRTAFEYQKSMNKVKGLTMASAEEMAKMDAMAKNLGANTEFSAKQAADGMAFLGMAGFDTNKILQATPNLLNLASAGELDLARAADITSNIMGAFKIEAGDSGRIVDALATVISSSNVDMEQLADTMKFAAPVAKKFGASMEETAAAAGLLGNIGIQGSLAGTAMRTAFIALAAPTKSVTDGLKKIGVSTTDSEGNLKGFTQIIGELSGGLSGLKKAEALGTLNEIFGKRAIAGMSELTDPKIAQKLKEFSKTVGNMGGRAKELATIRMEGFVGEWIRLTSAFEGFKLQLAESGVLSFFSKVIDKLSKAMKAFSEMSDAQKENIVGWLKFAAVLGPALFIGGKMVGMISLLITGINGLMTIFTVVNGVGSLAAGFSLLLSPMGIAIGVIIAGLTAFSVLAAAVITKWDKLGPKFEGVFSRIAELAGTMWDKMKIIFDKMEPYITVVMFGVAKIIENTLEGVIHLLEGDIFRGMAKLATNPLDLFNQGAAEGRRANAAANFVGPPVPNREEFKGRIGVHVSADEGLKAKTSVERLTSGTETDLLNRGFVGFKL